MTGRAGSKRRSKKDRVTSFARSIAGAQVKGLLQHLACPYEPKTHPLDCMAGPTGPVGTWSSLAGPYVWERIGISMHC